MSLISCPECNKKVSNTSSNCPNCGYHVSHDVIWYKNARIYEFVGLILTSCGVWGVIQNTFFSVFFIPGLIIFIAGRFLQR